MVDLRPLLSRNCPTATGATKEYMLFTQEMHKMVHSNYLERPQTGIIICNVDVAASHLCKSISIAASEFKAIVTIETGN